MFELERAISEWRRGLTGAGIDSAEVLDELESHLREDVQRQIRAGTSPQEAFNSGVQRFGQRAALKTEFGKINAATERFEKLLGLTGAMLAALILWASGYTFLQMELSPSEQAVAYAGVVFTLLTAWVWRYAVPFVPVLAKRGKRMTVGLGCIASGFVLTNLFTNFILPHFENADRQLPALGFWAVFPIAAFACLGLTLMMSADDREHWKMRHFGPVMDRG